MIQFYKYHGAGNDFVILNFLEEQKELTELQISQICNRHMGIGADGLMLLLPSDDFNFEMKYYNSNGKEGSMCGNGGRCIISFAYDMGIVLDDYHFLAVDGQHKGRILEINDKEKKVELKMSDVDGVNIKDGKYIIDTGSPHYIDLRDNVNNIDVVNEGRKVRYSDDFENGINVNFIEYDENKLFVRTYERGVENETLACGTGVTAAAIAASIKQNLKFKEFDIKTKGGELKVNFDTDNGKIFTNILLTGPATYVFTGVIEL